MAYRANVAGAVLGLALATFCSGSVFAFPTASLAVSAGIAPTPVVAFGTNARRTVEAFSDEHNLNLQETRREHAASGLVTCGDAHGAGQLTEANNVVTTAAHVLFDEEGNPRASECIFSLVTDGRLIRVPVDLKSIVAGSRKPYSVQAVHDWAVAKLEKPIDGVAPYVLADSIGADREVLFAARGHFDWGGGRVMSMESCRLFSQLNKGSEGTREFAFNCETGDGASGGAVLLGDDHLRLGAILVGWRSNSPTKTVPFSPTHYNFVVSIEGAFRDAVMTAARRLIGAAN
jgi:hypothetical protein